MAGKASVELCTEAESSGSVVQSMKLLFLMTEKESHKKKKKKISPSCTVSQLLRGTVTPLSHLAMHLPIQLDYAMLVYACW